MGAAESRRKKRGGLSHLDPELAEEGEDDPDASPSESESDDGADKGHKDFVTKLFGAGHEESKWAEKIAEMEKEEKTIRNLEARILKTSLITLQEQIGNESSKIKGVNMWQAHLLMKEREVGMQMFFNRSPGDDPNQEHYLTPLEWHSVILQFRFNDKQDGHYKDHTLKMRQQALKMTAAQGTVLQGIKEKTIDRYHFLKLLVHIEMTTVTDVQIENKWDSRTGDHLTKDQEPLLLDFEACQVLGTDLSTPLDERPMITVQQCMRIILETIIKNATQMEDKITKEERKFDELAKMYGTETKEMRSRARVTAELIEQRNREKIVMAGRKRDLRKMIMDMREYFTSNFQLKMDEVHYLEWNDYGILGGWQLRRNYAFEFLISSGVGDLVRAIDLLGQMRTNTLIPVPPYIGYKEKENEAYSFTPWLRQKLFTEARNYKFRLVSERDAQKNKKRYAEEAKRRMEQVLKINEHAKKAKDRYRTRANLKRAEMQTALAYKSMEAAEAEKRMMEEDEWGFPSAKQRFKQNAKAQVDVEEWTLLEAVADIDLETL